ncbi:hypothetical protein BRC88_09175 [Halobacteriales archaeon QS_4_69_225]|nr:MAG: hypothetical protein BRC88_09175 [Halobacteriales archaeon QS_4_69_225]
MSVLAVAEKDFRDAVRSRLMIVVAVMFVALTGGGVLLATTAGGEASLGILGAIGALRSGTAIFVPIIALGIAYRAIAGEQASGSLKLLLSLPNSRLDVVLGKFLGRAAVVTVAIVIGFVSMLLAAALTVDQGIQPEVIVVFMLSALLLRPAGHRPTDGSSTASPIPRRHSRRPPTRSTSNPGSGSWCWGCGSSCRSSSATSASSRRTSDTGLAGRPTTWRRGRPDTSNPSLPVASRTVATTETSRRSTVERPSDGRSAAPPSCGFTSGPHGRGL